MIDLRSELEKRNAALNPSGLSGLMQKGGTTYGVTAPTAGAPASYGTGAAVANPGADQVQSFQQNRNAVELAGVRERQADPAYMARLRQVEREAIERKRGMSDEMVAANAEAGRLQQIEAAQKQQFEANIRRLDEQGVSADPAKADGTDAGRPECPGATGRGEADQAHPR
jgi:hypothetical protein